MNKLDSATKAILAHLKAGSNSDWEAAEALALVVGTRDDRKGGEVIEAILKELPYYSKDRIYRLARAGRAYIVILRADEALAQECRVNLTVTHMEAISSCVERKDCTLQEAMDWLRRCLKPENKWSAERLRAELPRSSEFVKGGWNDKAKKLIPALKDLTGETLGANPKYVHRALRVIKYLAAILERMTQ